LPVSLRYPFDPPDPELSDLREMLLLLKCGVTLLRLRQDLKYHELKYHELKYSDDQPRWPAGDPLGGQWRPLEGGEGDDRKAGGDGEIEEAVQLAANDGTPGNNQAQNKQVNDVVRILGLTRDQRKELHWEITGRNLGFQEILRIGREIKGK
jgi:hypothetical protein